MWKSNFLSNAEIQVNMYLMKYSLQNKLHDEKTKQNQVAFIQMESAEAMDFLREPNNNKVINDMIQNLCRKVEIETISSERPTEALQTPVEYYSGFLILNTQEDAVNDIHCRCVITELYNNINSKEDYLGVLMTVGCYLFPDLASTVDYSASLDDCVMYPVKHDIMASTLGHQLTEIFERQQIFAVYALWTIMSGKNSHAGKPYIRRCVESKWKTLSSALGIEVSDGWGYCEKAMKFCAFIKSYSPMRHLFFRFLIKVKEMNTDSALEHCLDIVLNDLRGAFMTVAIIVMKYIFEPGYWTLCVSEANHELQCFSAYIKKEEERPHYKGWKYTRTSEEEKCFAPVTPDQYPIIASVALTLADMDSIAVAKIQKPDLQFHHQIKARKILALIATERQLRSQIQTTKIADCRSN